MTMGMALEGTRDYLRRGANLTATQCDIQFQGVPPASAGQFYVALDEGGVDTGDDRSYYLREIVTIEVIPWIQPAGLVMDRMGNLVTPINVYRQYQKTLDSLERTIIRALHMRHELRVAINNQFGLPATGKGHDFKKPLVYLGHPKYETYVLPKGDSGTAFIGRRLRFRGLDRIQNIDSDMG